MGIKLITAPATSPIALQEAKDHAYIVINDDDTLVQAMIDTSTELCQNRLGTQIVDATYLQVEQEWNSVITLLKSPAKSITTIKYYDENDVLQTLTHSDFYELDTFASPSRLVQKQDTTLPELSTRLNPIEITFVAGYDTIPNPIKQWLLIQTATFYKMREEFTSMQSYEIGNRYVDRLLDNYIVEYL